MATVFETARALERLYPKHMDAYERRMIRNVLDGLSGLGDYPSDIVASEYLTQSQMDFVAQTYRKVKRLAYGKKNV